MADLDRELDVIRMARELGLEWRHHPARRIVEFCVNRITGWLSELRGSDFTSIDKIERFICAKLRLVIEEVHSEADIDAIVQKYAVEKREGPFANLRMELDTKTF